MSLNTVVCSNENYIDTKEVIMSYKIITDSCGELPEEFRAEVKFDIVPLTISVDDYHIVDDESFNQGELIEKIALSPNCPKSSCPSPAAYVDAISGDEDNVYIITLSANLSGSYNSAMLAKDMYLEEHPGKNIHVFDSCSASVGQTQIAYWIKEYEEAGMSFDKIVEKCEMKRQMRKTYFILDNLETLRKNGRMSNVKAFVAKTLNIKPILFGTTEGTIAQASQARGFKKALKKMVELSVAGVNTEDRILMISHCNCLEKAEEALKEYTKNASFKSALIIDMRGISTLYANDGGIIVTF